ncbi:hypothetical protein [Nostoc sp. WHI]|uniref:hypothetical protein n=1 Tax=Nostoc sp. WHI TaxID=2650611 RepID=UPI0018C69D02|nr:hypothetical protein [Nostoc sp. WHI]MBG1268247.1 hypothetical protein [Nostoc sp. WHI]
MTQEIIDPRAYRELGSCFYLVVPTCKDDAEFAALMADADKICNATKQMLDGSINIEELLEAVEAFIPDMDDYLEEIEENMEESLIKIYSY